MENVEKNSTSSRTSRLGFRVTSHQEALIRKAAEMCGKNVTQFVLNSACEAAERTLIDQRIFFADEDHYQAFLNALEQPAQVKPKLLKRLKTAAPWEK